MKNDDQGARLRDKMRSVGGRLEEFRRELPERKTERIQLRVTPTEKREVESITKMLGASESDYLMHLHRRAMRELEREDGRDPGSKSGHGRASRRRPRGDGDSSVGARV
jgi:hypothetical protein